MRAFVSLPATFAFVEFAFSFPPAFAFEEKSVASTGERFLAGYPRIDPKDIVGEKRGYVGCEWCWCANW